jgi:hypothetical protein
MDGSPEPQTPEEAAALRELAVKHRRRHRWVALVVSTNVSVHTTVILHTVWCDWPLNARDLGAVAFFVVNACIGLGMLGWGLRALRKDEALGPPGDAAEGALARPRPRLARTVAGERAAPRGRISLKTPLGGAADTWPSRPTS